MGSRRTATPCGRRSRKAFILDVLKHYTTYATYFKLLKACEDDPNVERKKAAQALARFMRLHPHNIAQKTEVMVEHFQRRHAPQDRRPGQGDGGDGLAPGSRALQAELRSLHPGEGLSPSRRWWRSPARCRTTSSPTSPTPKRA